MKIKIKICGMKFPNNIIEIAALRPDYLGFIFYDNSPRYVTDKLPEINSKIQKVGVFVNADYSEIILKANEYQLDFIQLHGEESPEFCQKIESNSLKVIKSFNIDNKFNFNTLNYYNESCSYFLFDTKGDYYGGNGKLFNWQLLENYHLSKPYFLSGGIGVENSNEIQEFFKNNYSKNCIAIDCNSKLEASPGFKSKEKVEKLLNILITKS